MIKLIYFGRVESGKLIIGNRSKMNQEISDLPDMNVVITIEKKSKKRSLSQNSYLWGYLYPTIKEGLRQQGIKCTMMEVHALMKSKFLIQEMVSETTGDILTFTGSTAGLTTSGMMEYVEDIAQWSSEYLGVAILPPGKQTELL